MFEQKKGSIRYIKFLFCENKMYLYFDENTFFEIDTIGSKDENTLVVSINNTCCCHINKKKLFDFILTSMEGNKSYISFDIKNNIQKKRKRNDSKQKENYIIFRDDKFTFNIGGYYKEIVATKPSIYSEILRQLEFFHKNIEGILQEIYDKHESDTESDTEIDE